MGLSSIWRATRTQPKFRPSFDPFAYSKGRWLDRDQAKRDARKLYFDFDALADKAVKCCPGAQRVIDCEKKEGGFNRVFMFHLDNDETVAARLPMRHAGPPGLTTSSEVATLRFVKDRTTIPVPSVLDWSARADNEIGAEYMILETVPGVPLSEVWNDMKGSQHVACIRSIGRLYRRLYGLKFPAYGALYLNGDAPANAVRMDEIFSIGPLCAPQHWNCGIDRAPGEVAESGLQGPWHTLDDYFADSISRAKRGSSQRHSKLLDDLQATLHILKHKQNVQKSSGAVLLHPDFHTRNIFVDAEDHTKITGIIDWQSAAIEPAFVFAADTPDFARELPDDEHEDAEDISDEVKAANEKTRIDMDFCVQTWCLIQQVCENFRAASHLDLLILRVLAAPSIGWTNQEIILETLLNDLAEEWEQLGLPGSSIYQISKDEDVVRRLDEYQATRRMQVHLTGLLRCDDDGWVSNERWEGVLRRYRVEYGRFVESVMRTEEAGTEEEKTRAMELVGRLWPWDQR